MKEDKIIEILERHDSAYSGPMKIVDIISAMKEAMREESIGFAKFIMSHTWQDLNSDNSWKYGEDYMEMTDDEIYAKYLKHNEK